MKLTTFALAMTTLAAPAFAESHMAAPTGDVASGEEQFGRQCVACHVVQDPESGEVLAGRNAKVGPNLFGLAGKAPAHVEGFNYGDALVAYGETGAVWNEETFVGYVQNPTAFLRDALDDKRARSKMAYQVRDAGQAADLYAYLASFGPAE